MQAMWGTGSFGEPMLALDHLFGQSVLHVQVEATMYSNSSTIMKQRTYNVCNDVKYAHRLIPIVTAPSQSADGKPRVLWSKFHDTMPVDDSSAAGRAGSISIWPEEGQLPDPAGEALPNQASSSVLYSCKSMFGMTSGQAELVSRAGRAPAIMRLIV